MKSRKKPLLKKEIEMIQLYLQNRTFPTFEYRMELCEKLENLKKMYFKTKNPRGRR